MKSWCLVTTLVATCCLGSARGNAAQQEAAGGVADEPVGRSATSVALIPVPLPLVGDTDQQVMAAAEKAMQALPPGENRGIMIFEFRVVDDETAGTTRFERALSLARFLVGEQFSRVRTVAYVPASLDGHAVLPVLACEEIIMAPSAQLGAAGRREPTIDATMRAAYREMAERRRTVPVPVALAMLDSSVSLVEAQLVGGGSRYVLADELPALRSEVQIWKEDSLVPAGEFAFFSGVEMRQRSFASHLAADRKELADALRIAPESIRENAAVAQAWRAVRLDVRGTITSRTADEVIRGVRDIERRGSANLVLLHVNSSGGQAAASLRIMQLLAELDSRSLRTVVFVEREARSVAALIALGADETYAPADAQLGGPGDVVLSDQELAAMRVPIQELARVKHRDWSLLVGLVDPRLSVFRCRHVETGIERYFSEEERAALADPDVWKVEGQVPLDSGLTGGQALQYGLLTGQAERFEEVVQRFNVREELSVAQPNSVVHAIERLATQAWFARTLLFVAFFALITEASSPGVGVAGFVSGLCFLLFFWCQFLNGTAGWLEMMLFLGGLTCVALEIFVLPGFGVFGVGGAVMVLASIVLASQTFVWPRNTYQVEQVSRSLMTMVVACAGVLSALWLMRKLLAESWLFRRLMLIPPSQEVDLDRLEAIVDWRYLLGKRGVTTTQLTPSGKARFGDDVVNVISDGILVPKDTPVHVVDVRGNRVQVEPLEES